jgi:5-methyltetrahydrofolate--homocysteine methyltransferase
MEEPPAWLPEHYIFSCLGFPGTQIFRRGVAIMDPANVNQVKESLLALDSDRCMEAVRSCLADGISPWDIISEGLGKGMREVGDLFEQGEFFLGDLVMAGHVMKEVMAVLEDRFDRGRRETRGKIILATVKGDIHELGKNIVGIMLSGAGYEIIDLGIDVGEDRIVKAVNETGARAIGLTMLLTTAAPSVEGVVDALSKAGLRDRVKIAIGGASANDRLARDLKLDAYGENAVRAVRIFDEFYGVAASDR